MLAIDREHTYQSHGELVVRPGTRGLISGLSGESPFEGQLGGAFGHRDENDHWGLSKLGANRSSQIPVMYRGTKDVPLEEHVRKARKAIARLLERKQRDEQHKIFQSALTWLATNRDEYAGQWVALRGGELLAAGNSARDVYARARAQEPSPLVVKIESEQLPFAGW